MKEIEELQEEVTINEMIDVLLLDQLNAIYHQHGSQSNYYAERRDRTRFALLSRFRELEKKVEIERKDKDEAVKSVRIQYDSVCDMFHKREREYEDRITDLNNALINQLETGKQKTIYINQLEKENERLKNPIIESLHYDQNGLDIWASHPIIKVLAEETVRLLKLSNAENFVVVSLDDKERNGYTLTIKKNNGKSIEEKYEEVSKEVENLKCCANCFNLARTKNCTTDNWHENPRKSCDNWIFDGYKK